MKTLSKEYKEKRSENDTEFIQTIKKGSFLYYEI